MAYVDSNVQSTRKLTNSVTVEYELLSLKLGEAILQPNRTYLFNISYVNMVVLQNHTSEVLQNI